MPQDDLKTIFVSIASYRVPDCENTVRSLFENAAHPERLALGICWQFVPLKEPALLQIFEYQERLRQGEDYYFQVDSQMRFVSGWDEKLIRLLEKCPSPKPVLSTYPLPLASPDNPAEDALVEIRPRYFDEHGVLHQHSALHKMPDRPQDPARSFLVSAGMLFTRGEAVREVPYDPNLYFTGEEIILALRLWTHGWDVFNPNGVVAYHNYQLETGRRRHWEDQSHWSSLNRVSVDRIRFLTGQDSSPAPESLMDINRYGLGSERTIHQYQEASGLDFAARAWHGKSIIKP